MAATPAQIRNKAARKLGILARGQTLKSDISQDLDNAYNEVFAELRAADVVSWSATASVPDEVVGPIVALVALSRVDEYGVSNDRLQRIASSALNAEPRIRRAITEDYFSNMNNAEYY